MSIIKDIVFELEKLEETKRNSQQVFNIKDLNISLDELVNQFDNIPGLILSDKVIEPNKSPWIRYIFDINVDDEYLENFDYSNTDTFNYIFEKIRSFLNSNENVVFEVIPKQSKNKVLLTFTADSELT